MWLLLRGWRLEEKKEERKEEKGSEEQKGKGTSYDRWWRCGRDSRDGKWSLVSSALSLSLSPSNCFFSWLMYTPNLFPVHELFNPTDTVECLSNVGAKVSTGYFVRKEERKWKRERNEINIWQRKPTLKSMNKRCCWRKSRCLSLIPRTTFPPLYFIWTFIHFSSPVTRNQQTLHSAFHLFPLYSSFPLLRFLGFDSVIYIFWR